MKEIPSEIHKFQIINSIGHGNFGFVLQAYDPLLKASRAIKLIKVADPYKYVEAIKEAQTLEACRHKHIVDVKEVDVFVYEDSTLYVYIAMEFLAEGSIQKYLESDKFLSIQKSLKIISEALLGLEHAHNNNVLHRDIKPGNILFGDNGEAKLSDFGLALDYHIDPSDTKGYRPHQPLEVINGNSMNKLSDIYAMGITLYRLVNNISDMDFSFSNENEWKAAVQRNEYPNKSYLPHVPKKIQRIINKAINNDPNKRYQSASDFRQAIEKMKISIDWSPLNDTTWAGVALNGKKFEIKKIHKKNGWTIDYKKNGRRVKDHCIEAVSDEDVSKKFFKIIKETL